jgi:hypothetical protein
VTVVAAKVLSCFTPLKIIRKITVLAVVTAVGVRVLAGPSVSAPHSNIL